MPLIELGRIPGIRRAVRSQRTIQDLLLETGARLDHLGDDVAALLESAGATATTLSRNEAAEGSTTDSLVVLRARVADLQERIGRLEVQLADIASEGARSAASNLQAIQTHEWQSSERTRSLAIRVDNAAARVDDASTRVDDASTRVGDAAERVDRMVDEARELEESTAESVSKSPKADDDSFDLALCAYLAPFLSEPRAIDAGAHRGRLTFALISQGFDVIAIEADPGLASNLRERLDGEPRGTVREAAASDRSGRAAFYVAETLDGNTGTDASLFGSLVERTEVMMDLRFRPGPTVELITLDTARLEQEWDQAIGLVKIDVEGEEVRVINGLGAASPEVVMAEYWGPDYPLGVHAPEPGIGSLVAAMIARGARRWITIVHENDEVGFMVNNHAVPASSWGNAVFFSDAGTFAAALDWCRAHLDEHRDALASEFELVSDRRP